MTTTTTNTTLPGFVQPYAEGYLQRAQAVADMPYQQYTGDRVAGFNSYQTAGLDAMANRALSGSPLTMQAQQTAQGMIAGAGDRSATNAYNPAQWTNTYNASQVSPGANPYMGMDNPYLSQQIDAAQGDLVRNWNNVQAPQFDTAMARSGSFGNTGVAQAAGFAASDLQRNMGRIASDMRFQNYGQQLNLAENGLNRSMQAQQFNAGLMDNNLNRNLQRDQFTAGLNEQFASRNDAMNNASQARVLQALGLAPTLANQDYADIGQLMNAGNAYQQQDQRGLDAAYQQFLDSRNYPQQQLDIMGNALSRSYGQTTSQTGQDPNRIAQMLGGALTFAQLAELLGLGG